MNREQWLMDFTTLVRPWFEDAAGIVIPKRVRVSCGFPSTGARSGKVLGQCFLPSDDPIPQLFVHPMIADTQRVADILVHELIHACLPADVSHKAPFARAATALLLEGKPTATIGGDAFRKHVRPLIKQLGKYPHAPLDISGTTKQGTRLLKAECPECGLILRITAKWMNDCGYLNCPNPEHEGEPVEMKV